MFSMKSARTGRSTARVRTCLLLAGAVVALLGAAWKRANGFSADPPPAGAKGFLIAFVLSVVMAVNLAMFLNAPTTTLAFGAMAGFLAGAGWVAVGMGIVAVFEHKSWKYVMINGGYLTVALTVMGAILGGWR